MMSYMGFFSARPPVHNRTFEPMKLMENVFRRRLPLALALLLSLVVSPLAAARVHAQETPAATAAPAAGTTAPSQVQEHKPGGEANLVIPDLKNDSVKVTFFGKSGHTLLMGGLVVCALGLIFGLVIYTQLKNMAVHESMRE